MILRYWRTPEEEASRFDLELKVDFLGKHSPSVMDDQVQSTFAAACDDLSLTHISLTSGAGHDGQSFDGLCPVGMIFVPSKEGASHSLTRIHRMERLCERRKCFITSCFEVGNVVTP